MIKKSLINKLHDKEIINKNSVLWWQLGFEGRRVYSEKEFSKNLREIKYQVLTDGALDYNEETLNVWVKDDVPILLKDINFSGFNIPIFVTVKPMSHQPSGWGSLRSSIEFESPSTGMMYEQPHIRGVVIDLTDKFLFFYTFLLGGRHNFYASYSITSSREDNAPIMLDPIHPTKFYKNLIDKEWGGRRCQRKASCLNLNIEDLEFVPFFEFDVKKPHITIYPLPVFEGNLEKLVDDMIKTHPNWDREDVRKFLKHYYPGKIREELDLPIILKSSGNKKVNLLGAGYISSNEAFYWPLDERKYNTASQSLKERFGLNTEK